MTSPVTAQARRCLAAQIPQFNRDTMGLEVQRINKLGCACYIVQLLGNRRRVRPSRQCAHCGYMGILKQDTGEEVPTIMSSICSGQEKQLGDASICSRHPPKLPKRS